MGLLGSLGSLNVLLSADTAQFSSAMEKAAFTAESNLQRMAFKARLNSALVVTALTAIATGTAATVLKFADMADALNDLSKSTGISVENLSRLKYASKLSGVEFDSISTSAARLNKAIASNDPVFKSLGISTTDATGRLRSTYEVLLDVADAFEKHKDGAGKADAAQKLFGRSGGEMIPMLNEGRSGLKKYGDEAERFGAVISTKVAQSADKFNDNIVKLRTRLDGLIAQMAGPAVQAANDFWEAVEGPRNMNKDQAQFITNMMSAGTMYGANMSAITDIIMRNNEQTKKAMTETVTAITEVSDAAEVAQEKIDWVQPLDATKLKVMEVKESTVKLGGAARDLGFTFSSSFEDAIIQGKRLRDVFMSLLQDIERIIIRTAVTQPLANAITAGISSFMTPTSTSSQVAAFGGGARAYTPPTVSAHGNIFNRGNLVPFASGGVINRPSMFPMANGGVGIAGEAGTEAILPLFRTGGGDLGVKGSGGSVTVNVYAPEGSNVKQERSKSGGNEQINIMIDEATAGAVGNPGSKTYKALRSSFGLKQSLTSR